LTTPRYQFTIIPNIRKFLTVNQKYQDTYMNRLTFDLDVLRGFVLGIELGSFAKAADRLGRSTSAISAQLKKLESQVGQPIVRQVGRGLVPTPLGETVLSYARRMLALNDEAAMAIRGASVAGHVRIGMQEDFGESLLTPILADFAGTHPNVQIVAHSARHAELNRLLASGQLDLAVMWDIGQTMARYRHLANLPMRWIGPADHGRERWQGGDATPLVVFDAPCAMRAAAVDSLDRQGLAWRIAFTSLGLGGIWAAVGAGLGLTVRTELGLPANLRIRDGLPALPSIDLLLQFTDASPNPVVEHLADIVGSHLGRAIENLQR
jgi:DNA-binding transcriptional LysR family regulator